MIKPSRDTIVFLKYLLEEIIPPAIRDSDLFSILMLKAIYGNQARMIWEFQNIYPNITQQEYEEIYREIRSVVKPVSDISYQIAKLINKHIIGSQVIDVGYGSGFLLQHLATLKKYNLHGADILPPPENLTNLNINFSITNIESLPYEDRSFDTVISTHVLEHVRDFNMAVAELRRITRQRLIIVVPKERPYRHTPNLHLRFFPFPKSLVERMGRPSKHKCFEFSGDIFYIEDWT